MKRLKRVWVREETHRRAKTMAAEKGCSIADAIEEALGGSAKDNKRKVNSYGLFK